MNTTNTSDVTTVTTHTNTKTYSGKQVLGIGAGALLLGAGLNSGYRWARTKMSATKATPAATPAP